MRQLSPIRSASPINRPRITFNYPLSPLKQQSSNQQIQSPQAKQTHKQILNAVCESKVQKYANDNQKCMICTNIATHKSNKEGNRYCSRCALLVIKKGVQVVRIDLKQQKFYKQFQQKRQKENIYLISDKIGSSCDKPLNENKEASKEEFSVGMQTNIKQKNKGSQNPQLKLQHLLKESTQMRKQMQTLLQQISNTEVAEEGIKNFYKVKKLGLKKHYELIKATIKLSIQKDLEELELRERKSMKCLEQVKNELDAGIDSINQLNHRIQHIAKESSNSSDFSQLFSIINQTVTSAIDKKTKASQFVTQMTYKQANQADTLHVMLTQQQLQQTKHELYDPLNYTLLQNKNGKSETLFSFDHRNN